MFDRILGPAIRRITTEESSLFLTFDDGPDSTTTPRVLDVLARHDAKATFFVVARNACANRALMARIIRAGHTIGNHSFDHSYKKFFAGRVALKEWIERSEDTIREITGEPTIGFRSPVGIRTPELHWALRELDLPLILWERRFFDTTFTLTRRRATRSLARTKNGAIVLLHDRQTQNKREIFLDALDTYCDEAQLRGLKIRNLNKGNIK